MSDESDHSGFSADELLAAEYALGVLDGEARASAATRIERDRSFALMVETWQEKLAPWIGEVAEVTPPAVVWERIASALPADAPKKQLRPSLWQSLAFWRGLTVASGALAAACLGLLIYVGSNIGNLTPPAPMMAMIDGGGHHHFVATLDSARGSVAVVPAAYSADATRVPELWLIPADGKPRALGLLSAERVVSINIPAALRPHATPDAVLAVSLEPQGGSTTGQPTGPVIASGKLTRL